MSDSEARSSAEVGELKASRGGAWPIIRWVRRRRPLLTAMVVMAAPLATLITAAAPANLIDGDLTFVELTAWALMFFGVAVRLWGSGNLWKNREITSSGIYGLVRHPLYLGSLSLFLAYFLTVGDARLGLGLFALLVGFVYYPTMMAEEEHLTLKFPAQFARYKPLPRLLPDIRRLPEALRSDRFGWRAAYRNLGFRSAWFLLALPLFLVLLGWLDAQLS